MMNVMRNSIELHQWLLISKVLMHLVARLDHVLPLGLRPRMADVSSKPRALVRITGLSGTLRGKIEKVFAAAGESANPKCDKCDGALKHAPVVGQGYRSKLWLIKNGRRLSVRGYIGVPMLGRSQTWVPQE